MFACNVCRLPICVERMCIDGWPWNAGGRRQRHSPRTPRTESWPVEGVSCFIVSDAGQTPPEPNGSGGAADLAPIRPQPPKRQNLSWSVTRRAPPIPVQGCRRQLYGRRRLDWMTVRPVYRLSRLSVRASAANVFPVSHFSIFLPFFSALRAAPLRV